MMKVSMLSFSQTGNTLKVGKNIENRLQERGFLVSHVRFLHRRNFKPEDSDVIGVGCPCFESRPAEIVPAFLKKMNYDFTGKKAFVYITSSSSPAKTLWRLSQAVSRTGAQIVGGVQVTGVSTAPSMFGLTPGKPDKNGIAHARSFGNALSDYLIHKTPMPEDFQIDPEKGSRFYDLVGLIAKRIKKKVISPPWIDLSKCSLCGNCIHECPLNNFRIKNGVIESGSRCTVCWRCWHVCPDNAVQMKLTPGFNGLMEHLIWSETLERFFGELKPGEDRGKNFYKEAFAGKVRLRYNRKHPTSEYAFSD